MKRNKEEAQIANALSKTAKPGRILKVVFVFAAAFFGLLVGLSIYGIFLGAMQGVSGPEWVRLVSTLVQDLVMLYAFIVCALVARDASRAITPFSAQQVRRTLSVGWVLLGYTLFCLVLDPIAAQVQYAAGVAAVSLFGSPQAGELFINFETLIAAGAFFLFSYILNYGKTLQELADETA